MPDLLMPMIAHSGDSVHGEVRAIARALAGWT
jgi:hypothetical protein